MSKQRLAVVISHPIQHFAPVYAELAKSEKVELKIFFVAENGTQNYPDQQFDQTMKWDIPLLDGYQHEFVEPGNIIQRFTFFSVDSKRMVSALERFKPDFVWLHGYGQLVNWRSLLARPNGCQFIYTSDSNLADVRSTWRRVFKSAIVRFFLRRCHHFLSISPSNKRYLQYYGVADEAISSTSFPVDIERLCKSRDDISTTELDLFREQLGFLPEQTLILFVGKLVAHKRPQDLLHALSSLPVDYVGLVVGSGPETEKLQSLSDKLQIADRVHFAGFVNQSRLAHYFGIADIFLFPSEREPYGAIAAEVLPFGLPIVASSQIGAVGASIFENQNAILFDPGNHVQIADCIRRLRRTGELHAKFSKASTKLAAQHDKSVIARDIIRLCTNRPDQTQPQASNRSV